MPWRELKEDLEHIPEGDSKKAKEKIRLTQKARKGQLETEYDERIPGPRLERAVEQPEELKGVFDTQRAEKRRHNLILENAADVKLEIEALAKRYNQLVCLRITERPLNLTIKFSSLSAFASSVVNATSELINSLRSIPEEKDLRALINDVNFTAKRRVRPEDQEAIDLMIADLKGAVDDLAEALELVPRLVQLDKSLSKNPFEDHARIEKQLNEIYESFDAKGRSTFFKPLGLKNEHVLNSDRWDKYYKGLAADLTYLPRLKLFFEKRQNIINEATTEAQLFEVDDPDILTNEEALRKQDKLTEMSRFIQKHFTYLDESTSPPTKSFSRRYTKLDEMVARLKSKRRERIETVKRAAESVFDTTKQQFVEWKSQLDEFKKSLSDPQKGLTFPWQIFPPSKIDVEEARNRVQTFKDKFKDWPSATLIFNDKCMDLEGHDFVLQRMKTYGEQLINGALDYKRYKQEYKRELPYKTLQGWINNYKKFLFKTMIKEKEGGTTLAQRQYEVDPKAKKIIDTMERQLFFYAHRQIKSNEWFSWIRNTFWKPKPESQAGWADIITHANGGNQKKGFTGKRTMDTLTMLGWLNKDKGINRNIDESPECLISEWHLNEQAKRNAQISFTGKTTLCN